LREAVDDCVQETFLTLWNHRVEVYHHENITGWLMVTATNIMGNHYKKEHRRKARTLGSIDNEDPLSPAVSAYMRKLYTEDQIQNNRQRLIADIEEAIGVENFNILIKYYDKNITVKELAAELGVTPASLRMRVKRMLDTLRRKRVFSFFTLFLLHLRFLRK
jgi:RNA polymerase sigma factor (sigma-70 family)